ncbi:MAG: MOP flippase family protein [Methanoregula sp.]
MTLKKHAISGIKWTTIATIVTTILTVFQLIILARILGPEAYGLMGMVLIVIGFAQAYADFGISNAIIYRQDTTKNQLSSLFWLNVIAGVTLFIIIACLSPVIAIFFNEPLLVNLILLTALTFIILPFGQQFQILLQKELIFDKLSLVQIFSVLSSTIISIILAIAGFGVYALVWGSLTGTFVKSTGFLFIGIRRWKPDLHFQKTDLVGYLDFGLYQMGERSVNYFNSNIDKIIIGKFFSAEIFGFYTLAYTIILYPFSIINPVLSRVAFPVFSKLQDNISALKFGFLKVLKLLSLTNFPLYFGLGCTAYLFIPIFFGKQWMPSVIIIEILVGVGLLKSTGNPIGSLLLALGQARLGFIWNVLLMFTQIPVIVIGAIYGGIVGVALAYLFLEIFYFGFSYLFLIKRLLGPCLREYLNSMYPAFWMCLLMTVGVICASFLIQGYLMIVQLCILVSLGIFIYCSLLLYFERNLIDEMVVSILPIKKGE